MCFSATASFTAGAALTLLGTACAGKVKSSHQIALAGIPFVFALQQFTEGVVWLSLTHESWSQWLSLSSYGFLIFAQVIWPIWLPVTFFTLEGDPQKKKFLRLLIIPGVLIGAYFLYCLLFRSMTPSIVKHHVFYDIDFPVHLIPYAAAFYLTATVLPPLLSKDLKVVLMGVIILVAYIVARVLFQPSLLSVWCFLAIIISGLALAVLTQTATSSKGQVSRAT